MHTEYKIIGGDGAEYGPATLDELQSWIGDGRVAGSTQVWRSDLAHWSPAARYAELQQALARLHASAAPTAASQTLRPAGFWLRFSAYMLDRLVLALLFFGLFWGPLAQWKGWAMPEVPQEATRQTIIAFVNQVSANARNLTPYIIILTALYDTLMNGTFGATLGKMAVGAKILCADGSRLGYSRALLRSLAGRLTEMLLYWGYLWVGVRKDKRGMHDFIAGTKVVYSR